MAKCKALTGSAVKGLNAAEECCMHNLKKDITEPKSYYCKAPWGRSEEGIYTETRYSVSNEGGYDAGGQMPARISVFVLIIVTKRRSQSSKHVVCI